MDEKISKVLENKEKIVNKFVNETKEKLDTKLEHAQEKRDEIIEQTKTKIKEHVSKNWPSTRKTLFSFFLKIFAARVRGEEEAIN